MRENATQAEVAMFSSIGECSTKQAAFYLNKYGSVREGLIALEGNKMCRRTTLSTTFCVVFIAGLIYTAILENEKVKEAREDPRTETKLTVLEEYPVHTPFLVIHGPLMNVSDPIWEIAGIMEEYNINNAPEEQILSLRYDWDHMKDDLPIAYCMGRHTTDRDFCTMCGPPLDPLMCRGHSEDSLLCENGMSSPLLNDSDFSWTYCSDVNSSRLKCPRSGPFMSNAKISMGGTEYGCGLSIHTLWNPAFNKTQNMRSCLDGTIPITYPSDCTRIITEYDVNTPFDASVLSNPGIYKICDSVCGLTVVPHIRTVKHQDHSIWLYIKIHNHKLDQNPNAGQWKVSYYLGTILTSSPDFIREVCPPNSTWSCWQRAIFEGHLISPGEELTLKVSTTVFEEADGKSRREQTFHYQKTESDMTPWTMLVRVRFEDLVTVNREYIHYSWGDSFQTVAAYITYFRTLVYIVFIIFVSRTLPDLCLEYIPRCNSPIMSVAHRDKLKYISEYAKLLDEPEDGTVRDNLSLSYQIRKRYTLTISPNELSKRKDVSQDECDDKEISEVLSESISQPRTTNFLYNIASCFEDCHEESEISKSHTEPNGHIAHLQSQIKQLQQEVQALKMNHHGMQHQM